MNITSINIQPALEITGWMTEPELLWLAQQASQHETVVEVGCYQGRSTRAMGDNAKGVVYAVDDWKGLRTVDEAWWTADTPDDERETLLERFTANLQDLLDSFKVRMIVANHAGVSQQLLPDADMVFIDGSHDYDSVKRDIETWLPKLSAGGLLCGHDINQEPVIRAVNELLPGAKTAVGLIWEWEKPK